MDRSTNQNINKEIRDNIKLFDLVYIKSNTNIKPEKCERIIEITKSYYYTKSHKFLISSLQCVNKNDEDLKIVGYKTNVKLRIIKKLENNLNFKCTSIKENFRTFELIKGHTRIDVFLHYHKESIKLLLSINHTNVFNGIIETDQEFDFAYKTTIKHLL